MTVRRSWPRFALECLVVLGLLVGAGTWVGSRYRLGVVGRVACLPGRLYLYRLTAAAPARGEQVVFRTDGRTFPNFGVGSLFLKQVAGVPGDEVEIDAAGRVVITGPQGYRWQAALEDEVLRRLGRPRESFAARYRIPPDSYFVMGTRPGTFDSRYWGLVRREQLRGKVVWVLAGYEPQQEKPGEPETHGSPRS